MFKCLNRESQEEIIILDARWLALIAQLRALAAADTLVCQECHQPVRVRISEVRRSHFAHKHRQDCPYSAESPEILQARAALYEWLGGKFGDRVTIERKLGKLRRPIDCWVNGGAGGFAYSIIEGQMKPDDREALTDALSNSAASTHWVFLSAMLHADGDAPHRVLLTTTERHFLQRCAYDEIQESPWVSSGQSLHYLNPDTLQLTSYRGLVLTHAPQAFEGRTECHPLAAMLVSPRTGEFVHPGEHERLVQYRREKTEAERQRTLAAEESEQRLQALLGKRIEVTAAVEEQPSQAAIPDPEAVVATCLYCGRETTDYWYLERATNNVEVAIGNRVK